MSRLESSPFCPHSNTNSKLTLAVARFGLVLDRVADPTVEMSAAQRLSETFGDDMDIVVTGRQFNGGAQLRDARSDEFGRRFFVSLIVAPLNSLCYVCQTINLRLSSNNSSTSIYCTKCLFIPTVNKPYQP